MQNEKKKKSGEAVLKQRDKQTNSKALMQNTEVKPRPLKHLQGISPTAVFAPADEKMAENYNTVLCPS